MIVIQKIFILETKEFCNYNFPYSNLISEYLNSIKLFIAYRAFNIFEMDLFSFICVFILKLKAWKFNTRSYIDYCSFSNLKILKIRTIFFHMHLKFIILITFIRFAN